MPSSFVGDGFGRYLFEYRHNGANWVIEILAANAQDAHERIKSLAWARYKGEIAATIPVPGGGLIARAVAYLRKYK